MGKLAPDYPGEPTTEQKRTSSDPRLAYARNRFRAGDRVRLSPEGETQFPRMRVKTGVVIGFGRQSDSFVRIRCGRSHDIWHIDLWERDESCPSTRPISRTDHDAG